MKKWFIIFSLLALIAADYSNAGPSRDLTLRFQTLQEQNDSDQLLSQVVELVRKNNLKIILAPGFISGLGKLSGQRNLNNLAKAFKRQGLKRGEDYDFAPFNTFQGINYNSQKLNTLVTSTFLQLGKKSLIVAHSMGGLHTEKMLVEFPETQKMVDRIVGIQNPWKGSLVADKIENFHGLNKFFHGLLRLFSRPTNLNDLKSAKQSIRDLRISAREKFYNLYHEEMEDVRNKIPVLEYAATMPEDEENLKSKIQLNSVYSDLIYLFKYLHEGDENDYFVSLDSQIRDDQMYFVRDKGDHLALVMSSQSNDKEAQLKKLATLIILSFETH